jgi:hypothetical protein
MPKEHSVDSSPIVGSATAVVYFRIGIAYRGDRLRLAAAIEYAECTESSYSSEATGSGDVAPRSARTGSRRHPPSGSRLGEDLDGEEGSAGGTPLKVESLPRRNAGHVRALDPSARRVGTEPPPGSGPRGSPVGVIAAAPETGIGDDARRQKRWVKSTPVPAGHRNFVGAAGFFSSRVLLLRA